MIIETEKPKKMSKAELDKKLLADREKDHELIAGVFRFHDDRNGVLKFRYKKYKGDEYREYELVDGQRYQLPRMVVKHLNTECAYKRYAHAKDQFGSSQPVHGALSDRGSGVPVRSQFADGIRRAATNANMFIRVPRVEFIPLVLTPDNDELMPSQVAQITYT